MSALLIGLVLMATLAALAVKGPRFAFCWMYLMVFALVPFGAVLEVEGLPELTARRAVTVAVLGGLLARRGSSAMASRFRWWDGLTWAAILSLSLSFGLRTSVFGMLSRLAELTLDWGFPYLLVRNLLTGPRGVREMLMPLSVATGVLALLSVYEARMASRVAVHLWNSIGLGVEPLSHHQNWRWGYLRACATFIGPITLGTYFACVAPLMLLWGRTGPLGRSTRWVGLLASLAGCVAALSRGPLMALAAAGALFFLLARRAGRIVLVAAVLGLTAAPLVMENVAEHVSTIRQLIASEGNTPDQSGYYRIALLMMYGEAVGRVGWFGDPSLVGAVYEEAWSLDNAFLYLFFIGGWLGAGLIIAFAGVCLFRGVRGIAVSRGRERLARSCFTASFAAVVACMMNVWFAPDYAPLFWMTGALVLNHADPSRRNGSPGSPRQAPSPALGPRG
jgi:hypothetical protein